VSELNSVVSRIYTFGGTAQYGVIELLDARQWFVVRGKGDKTILSHFNKFEVQFAHHIYLFTPWSRFIWRRWPVLS